MTNEEQIAALESTLADVDNGIALIEQRLQTPGPGSAGLTATLANLRARRTSLQLQIANLRAASVTVAPLGGVARMARGVPPAASTKTLHAFAKHLDRFAKSTLEVVGAKPAAARKTAAKKSAVKKSGARKGAAKKQAAKKPRSTTKTSKKR